MGILTAVLIIISYKMGALPKWRWGSKPSDDTKLEFKQLFKLNNSATHFINKVGVVRDIQNRTLEFC